MKDKKFDEILSKHEAEEDVQDTNVLSFDDSDFEKAEKVNSNSQLYKQAGNSIVVNVLEGILKNLLENDYVR